MITIALVRPSSVRRSATRILDMPRPPLDRRPRPREDARPRRRTRGRRGANEFRIKSYYGGHTLWGSYFCDTGSRARAACLAALTPFLPSDIALMLPGRRPPVRKIDRGQFRNLCVRHDRKEESFSRNEINFLMPSLSLPKKRRRRLTFSSSFPPSSRSVYPRTISSDADGPRGSSRRLPAWPDGRTRTDGQLENVDGPLLGEKGGREGGKMEPLIIDG